MIEKYLQEKSPPRKSIEKDITGRVLTTDKKPETNKTEEAQTTKEVSPVKQTTERRRSRILDAAEKLNNLSIQPNNTSPTENAPSPPTIKPKKVVIPGTILLHRLDIFLYHILSFCNISQV